MIRMRAVLDVEGVRGRLATGIAAGRAALGDAVLRDCAPYVPYRTGALMGSGRVEQGAVVYDAPHARRVYYGNDLNFDRSVHPLACAQWFEAARAVHGADWARAARDAVCGGL